MRIAPTLSGVPASSTRLAASIGRMPPRLRTLPERHGGRVVLGLLIAILALGLGLRMHAALTPPADPGNDAAAYMQIAAGLYEDGHYGGGSGAPRRAARSPAFIDNPGGMRAEPVALVWLPAAMLAFLWASDGGRPWRWLAPGALLGLATLTRPEYLPFVALFALLALLRVWRGHRRGLVPGIAAAALLVVAFCGVLA